MVTLDGTTFAIDIRPKDAKTKARLQSAPLDVDMETVTVWDGVWYRTHPDEPWSRASLRRVRRAGVDIARSAVDRLRSYLSTPASS
jgi:hypothetical protein